MKYFFLFMTGLWIGAILIKISDSISGQVIKSKQIIIPDTVIIKTNGISDTTFIYKAK